MLAALAAKLRSTPYWTGERSYNPDIAFREISDFLLYGVDQIRKGNDGAINRIFHSQIFDGRLPEGWTPPNIWPFKTTFGDTTLLF
jgi:hypothetical protein